MKELINKEFEGGSASLSLEGSEVVAKVKYNIAHAALPLAVKLADKLKAKIPGSIDDKLIDAAIAELKEELGIA